MTTATDAMTKRPNNEDATFIASCGCDSPLLNIITSGTIFIQRQQKHQKVRCAKAVYYSGLQQQKRLFRRFAKDRPKAITALQSHNFYTIYTELMLSICHYHCLN